MRVLLVEDDPGIARFVSRGLCAEGYDVEWRRGQAMALDAARAAPFDVFILDVGLEEGDGLELCRTLRAEGVQTPVLMLTARDTLADKLDGFRSGADDYLPKPFAFEELLARLNVAGRRGTAIRAQLAQAGPLVLDLRSREARVRGQDLPLTPREFAVLACLLRHAGRAVSRQAILDEAWGVDANLTENAIDVYVGYLRRHLAGRAGAPRIETVRGFGFRLITEA